MKAVYEKVYDFSAHNGLIDWNRMKAAGVDFVMLRAGYGENNIDERFYDNAAACVKLDIPFGIYWFSYAYTEEMAEKEAEYALEAVGKYRMKCPVSFDLEYDTARYAGTKGVTVTRELATRMAEAFCGRINRAGYEAWNYANPDYLKNMFGGTFLQYPLWFARYNSKPGRSDMVMWQRSSSGSAAGVKGNVDENHAYREIESIPETVGKPAEWLEAKQSGSYSFRLEGSRPLALDGKITNFTVKEFRCKDGSDTVKIERELLAILQNIREHFGRPVHISSAYRTDIYNRKVNGAKKSQHLYGCAADIRMDGISPLSIAEYAEGTGVKGIGMYDTFVHIDTRAAKYYWANASGQQVTTFGKKKNPYPVPAAGSVLKKGMTGEAVKWLQAALGQKGMELGIDGAYGDRTAEAVKAYQKSAGIMADGIAGAVTTGYLMG